MVPYADYYLCYIFKRSRNAFGIIDYKSKKNISNLYTMKQTKYDIIMENNTKSAT